MDNHYSATQLNMYIRCPKQYEFRYPEGRILPPGAALTKGVAIHAAVEKNFKQKIYTKKDLPLEEVVQEFSDVFDKKAEETDWGDKHPNQVKDEGVAAVTCHHVYGRGVQPVSVEEEFTTTIAGAEYKGFIDLTTKDKNFGLQVHDLKSSSKTPGYNMQPAHEIQLTIYAYAKPEAELFLIDTVTTLKKSAKMHHHSAPRAELPFKRVESYTQALSKSLITGSFPPTNPDSWVCSKKWCGYWGICPYAGRK